MKEFLKKIRSVVRHLIFGNLSYEHEEILRQIDELRILIGRQNSKDQYSLKIDKLQDAEFRIFSQFGEDGIIQYLIKKVPIKNKIFIEFGVGDYSESNTRFLVTNNNWQGLIIDGGSNHLEFLKQSRGKDLLYRNTLTALKKYLTVDNINSEISKSGFTGDIGLLSIDIDGMDYWIFKELDAVSPRILIIEYNSVFGSEFSVTVPYKESFERRREHYSNIYFGASLRAMVDLADKKGYVFVGSNSAGNNAFFIRKDVAKNIKKVSIERGYVKSSYRESLDQQGNLTYTSGHKKMLAIIGEKKLFDINRKKLFKIRDIYNIQN